MPFTAEALKAVQENDTNTLRELIQNGENINQRGTLKGQAEEIGLLEVAIQSKAHRVALLLLWENIEWNNKLTLDEYCALHKNTEFGDYYHLGKEFWEACAVNDLETAQQLHATALEINLYILDYTDLWRRRKKYYKNQIDKNAKVVLSHYNIVTNFSSTTL